MAPPKDVRRAVLHHLAGLDALLARRVVGVYVTGSTALGAFRPGRSDVDLVVVLDRRLTRVELHRLRLARVVGALPGAAVNVAHRRWTFPGTVNAAYVTVDDLTTPVSAIRPVASHSGTSFTVGAAFDVNPVMWTTLATRGIPVTGPDPATLGLDPEPHTLGPWCRENLRTWWRSEAARLRCGRLPRSQMAQVVVNVPRLWVTATTGEVVSKEEAATRARESFDERWHDLIDDALAWRDGDDGPGALDPPQRADRTAAWIDEVCDRVLSA